MVGSCNTSFDWSITTTSSSEEGVRFYVRLKYHFYIAIIMVFLYKAFILSKDRDHIYNLEHSVAFQNVQFLVNLVCFKERFKYLFNEFENKLHRLDS